MKRIIDEMITYRCIKKRTIKFLTVFAVLIMLLLVPISAADTTLKEKSYEESEETDPTSSNPSENNGLLSGFLENTKIGQRLKTFGNNVRNFLNKDKTEDKIEGDSVSDSSSISLSGGSSNNFKPLGFFDDLLTFHTNYSGITKSTSLGLYKTVNVNVDGVGGNDVSARVIVFPGFDFKSFSFTVNFNLEIKLLSGNSIDRNEFFESYVSLNFPGFILKDLSGKSIDFGYRSIAGEEIPSSCTVTYKLAPNFLNPIKDPGHIFEIKPGGSKNDKLTLFLGLAEGELAFNFEKFVQATVKIEDIFGFNNRKISILTNERTSVDIQMNIKGNEDVGVIPIGFYVEDLPRNVELVFKSNIKIIGSEKIEISYNRLSGEKVNVIFYRYQGIVSRFVDGFDIFSNLDYFYIKYLPKEFSFSLGLSIILLKGWIELGTGSDSVNQIGWFDDLFDPKECLYFSDLPTTGEINFNINLIRKNKISVYADKRLSLNGYFNSIGYFGGNTVTEFSILSDGALDVTILFKLLTGYFEIKNNLDVKRDITIDISSDYLDISLESQILRYSDQPFIFDLGLILNLPIYNLEAGVGISISNGWDFSISKLVVEANEIPVYMTGLSGYVQGNRVVDFNLDVRNIDLSRKNSNTAGLTVSFTPIFPLRQSIIDRVESLAFRVYVSKDTEFTIDSINSDIIIKEVIVPQVNVTYPEANELETPVVKDVLTVSGIATPGQGGSSIKKVEVMIANKGWQKASGTNSWSCSFDTTKIEDGEYLIRARSFDGTRYSAIDSVRVIIANHVIPTVRILIPSDGDIVNGVVSIEGIASPGLDNRPIERVEIRVNEGSWVNANGGNYWYYNWDTSSLENGEYFISARSFDGNSYSVVDSVYVTKGQVSLPSVQITSPNDGSSVKGVVNIKGSSSSGDSSRPIEYVELSINSGEGWSRVDGTNSWNYNWDTSNFKPGLYAIRARSFDGLYNSPPAYVSLNVEPGVQMPKINITSPEDGADVSNIVIIQGTATAANPGRPISLVQIKINNGEWMNATGIDSWSFNWDSKTVSNGYYSIQARCVDSMGYEDTENIYVYVDNGQTFEAPTVRIDNPSWDAIVSDVVSIQGKAFKGNPSRTIKNVQLTMIPQKSFDGPYMDYSWVDVTNHNSDWSSWSYNWDCMHITAGVYLIIARSYDGEYYSHIPSTIGELLSSGSGVLVVVKNFEIGDHTFKIEVYKDKSTYVNIGEANLNIIYEKIEDDDPVSVSFSWDSLEIKSSNQPASFKFEINTEDNSVELTRSKIGNELTIEGIQIEANNLDLSFIPWPGLENVNSIIKVDKLVYDQNTPKDGGFFLELNRDDSGGDFTFGGKFVLSSNLELFGFFIKVNNFSYYMPNLHLTGPDTYIFGLNISIQNITWNIAQDFSWGWIQVGPSGEAYMDVDFSKYEGNQLVFEVSGAFSFSSGEGLFNLSWSDLGTDDFEFNAYGDLLVDVEKARFKVRDIFALDIEKIKSKKSGAVFSFDISQDDGTIYWKRDRESNSDVDLEIDLTLNIDKNNQLFTLPGDFNFVLQGDVSKTSTGQTHGETLIEWVKGESISITVDRDVNRNLDFLMEDFLFSVGVETVFSVDLSCTKFQRTIDQGSGQRTFYFDYNTEDDELTVKFETEDSPQITIEHLDLEVYVAGVLHAATGVGYFHKDSGSSLLLEITSVNIMGIINSLQGQGITLDDISGDVCFTVESNAKITLNNFYIKGDVGVGTDAFDVSLAGEFHMDKNTGRSTRIYAFADFDEKTFDFVLENQHTSQKIMEITNLDFAVSATVSGITGGLVVSSSRVRSVTNSGAILLEIDGTMVSVDDLSGKFAFSGSISSASVTSLKVAAGANGPNQNRVYMDGDFTFQNSGGTSTGFALVINSMSSGSLDFNFNHAHSGKTVIDDFTLGVVIPSVSLEVQIVRDYWEKIGSGSTFFDLSASLSGSVVNLDLIYHHQGSTEKLVQGLEVSVSVYGFGLKKYFDVTRMKSKSSYIRLDFSATGVNLNTFSFNKIELDWNHGTTKSLFEFNMALFDTTFNLKNGETSGTFYACVDRVQKYAKIERSHSLDWDWFIIDTTIGSKNFNFRIENARNFYGDLTFKWDGDLLGLKPTLLHLYTDNGVHGSYDFIQVMKNNEEIFKLIYGSNELSEFEIKVYNIQYSSNDKLKHLNFHAEWDYAGSCGSIRFLTEVIIETNFAGDVDAELTCLDGQGLNGIKEFYITSPSGITGSFDLSRNSGVKAIELTGTVDPGSEFGYKLNEKTGYTNSKHVYFTGGLSLSLLRVKDSQIRCDLTLIDVDANYVEFGVGDKDSANIESIWIESTGTNNLNAIDLTLDFNNVDIVFDALNIKLTNNFYAKKYRWINMPGDSNINLADEIQLNGKLQALAGSFYLKVTKDGSTSFEITTAASFEINANNARIGFANHASDSNKEFAWFSSQGQTDLSFNLVIGGWEFSGSISFDGSVRFFRDTNFHKYVDNADYYGKSLNWETSFSRNQGINKIDNGNLEFTVYRNGLLFDFDGLGSVDLKLHSNAVGLVGIGNEQNNPNTKRLFYFHTYGQSSIEFFQMAVFLDQDGLGFKMNGYDFGAGHHTVKLNKILGAWVPSVHNDGIIGSVDGLYVTFNGGSKWYDLLIGGGEPLEVDAKYGSHNNYYFGIVGEPVEFDPEVSGGDPPYSYLWTFGDGGTSTEKSPSYIYNSVGTYTAEITVTDSIGTTASDTATVFISYDDLEVTFGGDETGIEHYPVEFYGDVTGGSGIYVIYISYGDDSGYHNIPNNDLPFTREHIYKDPGVYEAHLSVSDVQNDIQINKYHTVTIYEDTNYDFSVTLTGPSGEGTVDVSYTFTATVSGSSAKAPYDYFFNFGDGNTKSYTNQNSNTKSASNSYSSTGTYTITVEVTDANNEIATDTFTFVVSSGNQAPTLSDMSVTPETGTHQTSFSYRVTYTDPEGDIPTVADVLIDDEYYGVPSYYRFPMTKESGDHQTGAVYVYTHNQGHWPGTHQFRFEFNDGQGHQVISPFQGGPSIEGWVNPLFTHHVLGWRDYYSANDNDFDTSAKADGINLGTTEWLELSYGKNPIHSNFPPLNANKIRFKAFHSLRCRQVEIQVHRTDTNSWYTVHDGTYNSGNIIEINIPGGPISVNSIRLRFTITYGLQKIEAEVFEADFYHIHPN